MLNLASAPKVTSLPKVECRLIIYNFLHINTVIFDIRSTKLSKQIKK